MTSSGDISPRVGEVWHARFNYDGRKGCKYRPVVVVGVREDALLVMMVTSSTNKLHPGHDYLIRDWEQAGLDKSSIARADRIAEIPPCYLGTAGLIGRFSERDQAALSAVLRAGYVPNLLITDSLNEHGIRNGRSRRAKLRNLRVAQMAAVLWSLSTFCSRESTIERHAGRFALLKESFESNRERFGDGNAFVSYFDFVWKLVDTWVPQRVQSTRM